MPAELFPSTINSMTDEISSTTTERGMERPMGATREIERVK
jgi:hypothetical protein